MPEMRSDMQKGDRLVAAEQNPYKEQIIARAMKDETFRQQLLSNPQAAFESELDITLPKGMTVQVHEDTPTVIHLVLPMKTPTGGLTELSDEDLKEATGGSYLFSPPFVPRVEPESRG
jgi:hypothetical protein